MKRANLLTLLLAAILFAGCSKTSPPAPAAVSVADPLPTHAQPRLRTMKIYLGAETLEAELALSPKEEQTGMMFRTNIQETDAMLFALLPRMRAGRLLDDELPGIHFGGLHQPDGTIEEIHHLEQNDNKAVEASRDNIHFVLETKEGWFARHNISPPAR